MALGQHFGRAGRAVDLQRVSKRWPGEAAFRRGAAGRAFALFAICCLPSVPAYAQDSSGSPSGTSPASQTPTSAPTPQGATQDGAVGQRTLPGGVLSDVPQTPQQKLSAEASKTANQAASGLWQLRGARITAVRFEGVSYGEKDTLPDTLGLKVGEPLDPNLVRQATRRLFTTGLYRDIQVRAIRSGAGVAVVFAGTPRYFIGRVRIRGVKSERLTSQLEASTQLQPGLPFTEPQVKTGGDNITQTLAQNGYYAVSVRSSTEHLPDGHQVNVTYAVSIGKQAQVGRVSLSGDAGISLEEFRKQAKLESETRTLKFFKSKRRVTHDTVATALAKTRAYYQKRERLEGTIALEKQQYAADRKQLDYNFNANQGPLVKVEIDGTKVSKPRQKKLLPIYEESAVDNDLLNEGAHNIQEFLQRQGFFDAEVDAHVEGPQPEGNFGPDGTPIPPPSSATQVVKFQVNEGKKYRVVAVNISGNKYFETDTIRERMQVVKANAFVRNGRYSPVLMENDVDSIESLYRANGFNKAKITTTIQKSDQDKKVAGITINVKIDEGPQTKFGKVALTGVDPSRLADMQGFVTAQQNQPFSLATVTGDRDNILQEYLAKGFDQARVEVRQTPRNDNTNATDITYIVTEGEEVFVDRILLSGGRRTKPKLIQEQMTLHPGDPLDGSALLEMQRRYYDLAIFNEANVAIQNPEGLADRKNVLVQLTEAKRWDVTYGAGFEAQLSTPQANIRAQQSLGGAPGSIGSPNGTAGASFRVSTDATRINLFGTDQSLTLHGTYGLLERIATATYNTPRFLSDPNLTAQISGGYSNVQNISTFKASTLQALFRVTQRVPKTDTFIYDFQYRRVSVDRNSLQVTANLIPLLSQPVRVGGPGFTWFHDTRNPTPLDAQKGQYLSVADFLSEAAFGSQVNFNRVDMTHSSYYTWGKKQKFTFARQTRIGFENTFSANPNVGVAGCTGVLLNTNASCDPVPLPERLYAGGATSHRGFGINQAGPRDLTTGYPVGGTAVFVNTFELRLPAPVLPVVGDSVSFVLFHDAGNVFLHPSELWPSFARFHQPNQNTCRQVTGFQTVGTCDFAYFSHAIGIGARYHTPVGPIRVDLSYNLNPPVYPIIDDYSQPQPNHQVGNAGHIQFFFSIGQAF